MHKLDVLVDAILCNADEAGLNAALVLYDPSKHLISGGLVIACPECSNYNQIAIMLRGLANKLDKEAMTREPCAKHKR